MFAEALEWLLTPTSLTARRMGLLSESIAIAARHRRCRTAWAPHLQASRMALLAACEQLSRRRVAVVLGSGHLLDVPLRELADRFEEVRLVDVVHPWSSRLLARSYRNVRLVELDVTASLPEMALPLPIPDFFLAEQEIDWVASVNLMSQLALLPLCRQARHGDALVGSTLVSNHLTWLKQFTTPVCLITDLVQYRLNSDGQLIEQTDFRPLLSGWQVCQDWRWDLAPPGELDGGESAYHLVAALCRQRQTENEGDIEQAQQQIGPD